MVLERKRGGGRKLRIQRRLKQMEAKERKPSLIIRSAQHSRNMSLLACSFRLSLRSGAKNKNYFLSYFWTNLSRVGISLWSHLLLVNTVAWSVVLCCFIICHHHFDDAIIIFAKCNSLCIFIILPSCVLGCAETYSSRLTTCTFVPATKQSVISLIFFLWPLLSLRPFDVSHSHYSPQSTNSYQLGVSFN